MITKLLNHLKTNTTEHNLVVTIKTPVKMRKKGNPFGEITKTQDILLLMNKSYTEAVNEQRVEENVEATFQAKQTWGVPIDGLYNLITHEGTPYLQGVFVGNASTPSYTHDGQPIAYTEFADFITASSGSSARQGVEHSVSFRKIKVDSIVSFKIR